MLNAKNRRQSKNRKEKENDMKQEERRELLQKISLFGMKMHSASFFVSSILWVFTFANWHFGFQCCNYFISSLIFSVRFPRYIHSLEEGRMARKSTTSHPSIGRNCWLCLACIVGYNNSQLARFFLHFILYLFIYLFCQLSHHCYLYLAFPFP